MDKSQSSNKPAAKCRHCSGSAKAKGSDGKLTRCPHCGGTGIDTGYQIKRSK